VPSKIGLSAGLSSNGARLNGDARLLRMRFHLPVPAPVHIPTRPSLTGTVQTGSRHRMPFLRNVVSSMCDPAVIAIVILCLSGRSGGTGRDMSAVTRAARRADTAWVATSR